MDPNPEKLDSAIIKALSRFQTKMIQQTNFPSAKEKPHSRAGIVSTSISILLPILMVFFIVGGFSPDA